MAEERLDEIRNQRLAKRKALLEAKLPPYPAEVRRSHSLAEISESFETLKNNGTPIVVAGRAMNIRKHGALAFIDLKDELGALQLQLAKQEVVPEIFERLTLLDAGDYLQAAGTLTLTNRGVKTLLIKEFHVISKSIRPLPDAWYGLKDHETRYRQREIDLLLNSETRKILEMRNAVMQALREYFQRDGYVEIDTPVLHPIAGGAAAKPFITHHNALDMPLYLRIASELYLKRMLVSGYEKVFEIGHRFRNEGISRQHNPEFTMLESQWAYADYEDYMDFTENILNRVVLDTTGSEDISWQGTTLSFMKPFKRERYVDLVSSTLGVDILEVKDPQVYITIFQQKKLALPDAPTYANLVDELYKELIRPNIIQPTILYDYPIEMQPLAKANATDPRIAEQFQLLVHGQELVKAYTELNDPVIQQSIFEKQQELHEAGNEEAHPIDEAYVRAMEYGMPPNAGWGIGVDRLIMLLADAPNIRDTIVFPLLRPEQ